MNSSLTEVTEQIRKTVGNFRFIDLTFLREFRYYNSQEPEEERVDLTIESEGLDKNVSIKLCFIGVVQPNLHLFEGGRISGLEISDKSVDQWESQHRYLVREIEGECFQFYCADLKLDSLDLI